jgi:hypothetical protein
MNRLALMWILLAALLCGFTRAAETAAPPASPQAPPPPPSPAPFPLEWVRLLPAETLKKFYAAQDDIIKEYENQTRTKEIWAAMEKEINEKIQPLVAEIIVREEPSDDARPLGTIRATIARQILSVSFKAEGTAEVVPFVPDLYLDGRVGRSDGYDMNPWCHQTITDKKGSWVRMPPHPWLKSG